MGSWLLIHSSGVGVGLDDGARWIVTTLVGVVGVGGCDMLSLQTGLESGPMRITGACTNGFLRSDCGGFCICCFGIGYI